MKGKLKKIIFVYKNETRWLEGKEAERWEEAANGIIGLSFTHGMMMPDDLKWKVSKHGYKKKREEERKKGKKK